RGEPAARRTAPGDAGRRAAGAARPARSPRRPPGGRAVQGLQGDVHRRVPRRHAAGRALPGQPAVAAPAPHGVRAGRLPALPALGGGTRRRTVPVRPRPRALPDQVGGPLPDDDAAVRPPARIPAAAGGRGPGRGRARGRVDHDPAPVDGTLSRDAHELSHAARRDARVPAVARRRGRHQPRLQPTRELPGHVRGLLRLPAHRRDERRPRDGRPRPRAALMVFNSNVFLFAFLPVVFALFWLSRTRQQRYVVLAVRGYVFSGYWDWRFCFLLLFSSLVSFTAALMIERSATRAAARSWVVAAVIVDLAVLGFFKYYNFFAANLAEVFPGAALPLLHVVLPIGI